RTALTATASRAPIANDVKPVTSVTPARTTARWGRPGGGRGRARVSGTATPRTPITRAGTSTQTTGTAAPTLPVANRLRPNNAAAPDASSAAWRVGGASNSRSSPGSIVVRTTPTTTTARASATAAESGSPA